jgi:hypothetical protein
MVFSLCLCLCALKYTIAVQEIARTNQNPRIEWRREAPPLDSWVLCPKQNLLCYIAIATWLRPFLLAA